MAKLERYIEIYGSEEGTRRYNDWKNKTASTLENFIRRHGEVEGRLKYEARWKKNTKSYQMQFCTEEEWKQKSKLKGGSLKNFIERHGEEIGKAKYEEYVNKCRNPIEKYTALYGEEEGKARYEEWKNKTPRNKEDFIRIFGKKEGLIKYNAKVEKSTMSLENAIRIHGEEEGPKRFALWQEKLSRIKIIRHSNESKRVLNILYKLGIKQQDIVSHFTTGNELKLSAEHFCLYDFFVKSHNLIIDYHGEIYHPNTERYTLEEAKINFERNKARKNTFEKQLRKDEYRKRLAEENNIRYIVIWSYYTDEVITEKLSMFIGVSQVKEK